MLHHIHRANRIVLVLCLSMPTSTAWSAEDKPEVRLITDDSGKPAFEAAGIPSARLAGLADSQSAAEHGMRFLTIHVVEQNATSDQPAMLGLYAVKGGSLRFNPRYALRPGVRYRASFSPSGEIGEAKERSAQREIVSEFTIPDASDARVASVVKIYPSGDVLPENLLRFYLHFSVPMSRGEAYRHVSILQKNGEPVDLPFLELGEELWDSSGQRLTLLIDPGRIKRGVKPREDLGPVLEEGKQYSLVVDRKWKDASGRPLAESFQKKFTAGPAVNLAIDPKAWKFSGPDFGTSEPLLLKFPRPLDHALLERNLTIEGANGIAIPGKVIVTENERCWEFHPERPWWPGEYRLVVDTILEDLVGNRIGRPFEVDRTETIERQVLPEQVRIPFQVRGDSRTR